jgi:hypothetical protein
MSRDPVEKSPENWVPFPKVLLGTHHRVRTTTTIFMNYEPLQYCRTSCRQHLQYGSILQFRPIVATV